MLYVYISYEHNSIILITKSVPARDLPLLAAIFDILGRTSSIIYVSVMDILLDC